MRGERIKEARFSAISITGSTQAATFADSNVNGEILRIRIDKSNSPGSVWIAESGTNIEIWRQNAVTSGTSVVFDAYPHVFTVNATNATGSPHTATNRIVNGPIYLAASGLTSGTARSFGPVTVFYR